MSKSAGKLLARYWGYVVVIAVVLGVIEHLAVVVVLILAAIALGYLLLQAPLWCGAPTRGGLACRNNSHGLLLGCWIREHKWQRLKQVFIPARWGELTRSLLGSAKDCLATVSAVIAIAAPVASVVSHVH